MKKVMSLILAMTIILCVSACGSRGGTPSGAQSAANSDSNTAGTAEYNLRLGDQLAQSHPYNTAAVYMAELIEERTNGRVHIDVFPSSQLGSERELLEGVQMGTVDMCIASGPMASFDSDFYIGDLPNLFTSKEHAYRVLDGEIGQNILDGLENVQMKGLSFWETGWLCMFNNERLIETPEDLKGLSMRTMENNVYVNYFSALDCNPVPMAYSEFVTSVSNGTINGTMSPIVTIYTDKTYEICPYITRAYQWYTPAALVMNLDVWNSFDDELKQIVSECAQEARDYERQQLAELEDGYIEEIKAAGGTVFDADTELWASQTDAIDAAWSEIVPSKVSQELIDQIRELAD